MTSRESENRVNGERQQTEPRGAGPNRQRRRNKRDGQGRTGARPHTLKTHGDATAGPDAARITATELTRSAAIRREQPWDWIAIA